MPLAGNANKSKVIRVLGQEFEHFVYSSAKCLKMYTVHILYIADVYASAMFLIYTLIQPY